ncbi:MAG: hypothetical protein NTV88_03650 [Candidatus Micrarchaeota archaeon]|nr:hypothetical protein [Candidatus Micrarchaeota archaeon]
MAAVDFNFLYYNLVVLLSCMVPGLALGWPLLKKSDLSVLEKLILCFFLGMVSVPLLIFIESMAGLGFSLPLAIANLLLVTAAGIAYGYKEKVYSLSISMPKMNFDFDKIASEEFVKKHAATVLLALVVFLAFWSHLAPYTPIYSELDPYWYVYGTGQVLRLGAMPLTEDTAWFPEVQSTHRSVPIKAYAEALWYSLYTGGTTYNNYLLFITASWLPPISAALAAFGAYLLFTAIYGRRYGLFAGALMAFLPIGLFKLSAGVNEAIALGLVGILMMAGCYALALKKKDIMLCIFAALAAAVCTLGSNYEMVVTLAFTGFVALQSIEYFIRGKKNAQFWEMNLILAAGILISSSLVYYYTTESIIGTITNLIAGRPAMAIAAVALSFAVEKLLEAGWSEKKRMKLAAGAAVIAVLLLALTPLGGVVAGKVYNFVGYAAFNQPLDRTIAEQNKAGASFEGEAGFIALVPANHIAASANDTGTAIANVAYGGLDLLCAPFTALGNAGLSLADTGFNLMTGGNGIATGAKSNSLLMFFLVVASIGLALRHFTRKGEERDVPSVMLLILLLTLPAAYVGLGKIKFVVFVGMAAVIAAVAAIAEIEQFFAWLAKKMKQADFIPALKIVFIVLLLLVTYEQAAGPMPYAKFFLLKSFEARYQDNPEAVMPKLAALCTEIKAKGYNDDTICTAGSDIHFADTIEGQYNSELCQVSQLSMADLLPANQAAADASADARNAASFRCNRLNVYWVDSMEWIRNNVPERDRITSWWDYGHWINYFGDRKSVLRNEHRSKGMIGRVAHDYLDGTTQDLTTTMNYYDSRYALFDTELIGGSGTSAFGGKYGALNYLACAHDNLTSTAQDPGASQCEFDHMPERILVPDSQSASVQCTISESQQRKGVMAFAITHAGLDTNNPKYCIGDVTLADGSKISGTYYMDRKDANGDLVLSKGLLRQFDSQQGSLIYELVYNNKKIWTGPNGTVVDGMEDAKGPFYTSNLYKAMFLDELPGFDKVYQSANGEVKIYRMKDFAGNPQGIVDPVAAAKTQ